MKATKHNLITAVAHNKNRWLRHSTGKGADWTKRHKPVRLFHFEKVKTLKAAMAKEKEWKKSTGRKRLKKILSESGRLINVNRP
jgi:predicted GIY-YIG superfamily endonuclease